MLTNTDKIISVILSKIRTERVLKKMSQDRLSKKLGISQNAYSKIESGGTVLTVSRLVEIAEILNIDVSLLFS
ncbi:helix-turn-helix transcriptional regulator [Mucilaginibacter sp. BJC16-A38]|uniref:helix-turn-helix domain-containing protein n=1 Tax=Mucilaginibacter phenanthrenivorans TaxID=1234842 RepID=UPI00215838FA|nr:helix-turn-helix transcriptional regulator [Mucilaginibacter phenanthrenivorans]MCR8561704.1 helix-turn-helix transcriptional regulator [Mucilaginibacter phenanthrenivorans]